MKRTFALLTLLLIMTTVVHAENPVVGTTRKIVFPDWLARGTLKHGFVASVEIYQAFNGMTEGYHFRQDPTYLINEGNYHTFATAQRVSGIASGWFGYALYRDKTYYSTWDKIKIGIGAGLKGRNRFEWAYKGVRYGNPFDYTEKHNKHALVYFGFRSGKLTDLYIGTGPVSGPLVDLAFEIIGTYLISSTQ